MKATRKKPSKRMTLQEQLAAERIRRYRAESSLARLTADINERGLTLATKPRRAEPSHIHTPAFMERALSLAPCAGQAWIPNGMHSEPTRRPVDLAGTCPLLAAKLRPAPVAEVDLAFLTAQAPANPVPPSEMELHALHGAALGWPSPGDPAPSYAREVRP